jgi:membrane protease YdiL (CAAX protease family)
MPERRRDVRVAAAGRAGGVVVLPLTLLVALTVLTQLASVAYTSAAAFDEVWLQSTAALLLVTTPLAAAGLWLGNRIGLGTPLLSALLAGRPGSVRRLVGTAARAAAWGLAVGALLWGLRLVTVSYLPPELPELGHRGAVGGLLVALAAAVGEEVWLRLGFMTIVAWLLIRVRAGSGLTAPIAWVAITVAAAAFGAIHLPQLAAAGAATGVGVAATLAGNMLVGILCGRLFWRHGLLAAIFAHFFVDLVLHVLPALVG